MLSTQQIFWSIAIVSSVLLVILLVMTLFDTEEEHEKEAASSSSWLDPRLILLSTTLFGWFTVIGSYLAISIQPNVIFAASFSLLLTFLPALLSKIRKHAYIDIPTDQNGPILRSTGQVLLPIPPHRNGFGKVQLDHRQTSLAMDAVTTGQELKPGAPVRVVDIIDNRILVVEPIQDEIPPDGGLRRMKSEE